jgi:uncharacterized protein (DUF1800 family)
MVRNKVVYAFVFGALGSVGAALPASVFAQPVRSGPQQELNRTLDAARLAQQATFGINRTEIARVAALGPNAWIDEQFAKPQTMHKATVNTYEAAGLKPWEAMMPSMWKQLFEADDHLRQRVTFALSQIMVISLRNNIVLDNPCGPASFIDMLGTHAFGNFRNILKDMTLHPAMGEYLDMKKSGKETTVSNPDGTTVSFYPNENYARELLQLFSVGTVLLNVDGSVKLDGAGKPIPAYDEATVQGFAKAFTGWTFAADSRDTDPNQPWRWLWDFYPSETAFPDAAVRLDIMCKKWSTPMRAWTYNRQQPGKWDVCNATTPAPPNCAKPDLPPPHDTGTKKLLSGVTLPANQTAEQDVDQAVDNIFNHPNVGPFISRQLIQRLTMSNPQSPYVERVAKVFNNNGAGVRGDMKSVIRAILMDPDARLDIRSESPLAGKLKEPVVRWVQFLRSFDAKSGNGEYRLWDLGSPEQLNQSPLNAPSVFNYYHPDALLPGQPSYAPVTAPEFELATANAVAGWADFSSWGMINGFNPGSASEPLRKITPNYTYYDGLAQTDTTKLVDELALVLTGGKMTTNFRTKLIDAANKLTLDANTPASERTTMVLWLIVNSPEFLIQK